MSLATVWAMLIWLGLLGGTLEAALLQQPPGASPQELLEAGRRQDAEEAFAELQRRRPLTPRELDQAVDVSSRLNHWDRVAALLRAHRDHSPLSVRHRVDLYEALLKTGAKDDAETELKSLRRDLPDDERFVHLLAFLHLSREQFGAAADEYRTFLQDHPDSIESRVNLALVLFKLEQGQTALMHLSRAFAQDFEATNRFFYRQLARNMPPAGLAQLAEDVKSALNLPPDGNRVHLYLAEEYDNLKRYDPAIEHYRSYLESEPDNQDVRLALARLYFRTGDDAACEAVMEPLLEAPGAVGEQARLLAAELAVRSGRFKRARELLDSLPADYQRNPLYLYFSARVALDQGDHETASRLLRQVIRLSPEMAEPYFHLAQLQIRAGNVEEGKRLLEEFQRRKP